MNKLSDIGLPSQRLLFILWLLLVACPKSPSSSLNHVPTVTVSTFVGSTEGFADGKGSAAQFHLPCAVALDSKGNFYVAEFWSGRIRKVTPEGEVSTLVEDNESDLPEHQFGIATDTEDNLYVVYRDRIGKFTPTGKESTPAWGTHAQIGMPKGITLDAKGNLYATDIKNHRIYKLTPKGEVSTLAGSTQGFADGRGSAAQFHSPCGIALDAKGNLYVTDRDNHRIRKLTPEGEVSTLAGSTKGFADGKGNAAQFEGPCGMASDAQGNLYLVDDYRRIRKVTPEGEVSTLAGSTQGFADGPGSAALFDLVSQLTLDAKGNLYVADMGNSRIRKITLE